MLKCHPNKIEQNHLLRVILKTKYLVNKKISLHQIKKRKKVHINALIVSKVTEAMLHYISIDKLNIKMRNVKKNVLLIKEKKEPADLEFLFF